MSRKNIAQYIGNPTDLSIEPGIEMTHSQPLHGIHFEYRQQIFAEKKACNWTLVKRLLVYLETLRDNCDFFEVAFVALHKFKWGIKNGKEFDVNECFGKSVKSKRAKVSPGAVDKSVIEKRSLTKEFERGKSRLTLRTKI